jgi:hypothetical protein
METGFGKIMFKQSNNKSMGEPEVPAGAVRRAGTFRVANRAASAFRGASSYSAYLWTNAANEKAASPTAKSTK